MAAPLTVADREEVVAMLEDGLGPSAIAERLRVSRQYVSRVRATFMVMYVPREVSPELQQAKRNLDRAYAAFERCAGVNTYGDLCKARRAYEDERERGVSDSI